MIAIYRVVCNGQGRGCVHLETTAQISTKRVFCEADRAGLRHESAARAFVAFKRVAGVISKSTWSNQPSVTFAANESVVAHLGVSVT